MKKKILAIDDSKAIRFLLQTVFGKRYEVLTAPDGYSAMHFLTNMNLPDVIIADPRLPDMKDWELIEYLTASGLYGDIPMFVLSAFETGETQERCKEFAVEQYFFKPFNPLDLLKAVDNFTALERKKLEVN